MHNRVVCMQRYVLWYNLSCKILKVYTYSTEQGNTISCVHHGKIWCTSHIEKFHVASNKQYLNLTHSITKNENIDLIYQHGNKRWLFTQNICDMRSVFRRPGKKLGMMMWYPNLYNWNHYLKFNEMPRWGDDNKHSVNSTTVIISLHRHYWVFHPYCDIIFNY